jgi:hypothetical protein
MESELCQPDLTMEAFPCSIQHPVWERLDCCALAFSVKATTLGFFVLFYFVFFGAGA